MRSVGGHSALRGTICTRAECPGGHCALGQDVRGDILYGETSCPPTPLLNCQCHNFERLGLGLTVTEINIKKVQKQDLKNIQNVKGCRDGMPKSMQTK